MIFYEESESLIPERKLVLGDIVWYVLKKWRVLLVFILLFAVLLGGVKYRQDYKIANTPVVTQSLLDVKNSLSKDDLLLVEQLVILNNRIDYRNEYRSNSIMMNIDPFDEKTVTLQYFIDNENDEKSSDLIFAYRNYVLNGKLGKDVVENLNLDTKPEYITELFQFESSDESSFSVVIRHSDEDECTAIADEVKNLLNQYKTIVGSKVGEHQLNILSDDKSTVVDDELDQIQRDDQTYVESLKISLSGLRSSLTDTTTTVLNNWDEILRLEAEGDEKAEQEENQVAQPTHALVSIDGKYVLMGGLIGFFFATALLVLIYILSGKLRNKEELNDLQVINLGSVSLKKYRKGLGGYIDKMVDKIERVGCKIPSKEQQIQHLVSNIQLACERTSIHKVCIVSTEKCDNEELLDTLKNELKKLSVELIYCSDVNYSSEALMNLSQCGNAIIMEEQQKSYYKEIRNEVGLCKENKINILGSILVEN